MKIEVKKLLLDVLEASESILKRCKGQSLHQYSADRWFRRTVEREFEIIGEALNRLEKTDAATASRITSLRRIIDFRNRVIHGYDSVDDEIVWGIVESYLPRLRDQAAEMLASQSNNSEI